MEGTHAEVQQSIPVLRVGFLGREELLITEFHTVPFPLHVGTSCLPLLVLGAIHSTTTEEGVESGYKYNTLKAMNQTRFDSAIELPLKKV